MKQDNKLRKHVHATLKAFLIVKDDIVQENGLFLEEEDIAILTAAIMDVIKGRIKDEN